MRSFEEQMDCIFGGALCACRCRIRRQGCFDVYSMASVEHAVIRCTTQLYHSVETLFDTHTLHKVGSGSRLSFKSARVRADDGGLGNHEGSTDNRTLS